MRVSRVASLATVVVLMAAMVAAAPAQGAVATQLTRGQVSRLMLTHDEIARATGLVAVGSDATRGCRTAVDLASNYCYRQRIGPDDWATRVTPFPTEVVLHSFTSNQRARDYIAFGRRVAVPKMKWIVLESSRDRIVTVDPITSDHPYRGAYAYQAVGAMAVAAWCAQKSMAVPPDAVVKCAKDLAAAQLAKAAQQ